MFTHPLGPFGEVLPAFVAAHDGGHGQQDDVAQEVAAVGPPRIFQVAQHAQKLPGHLGIHAKLHVFEHAMAHGIARILWCPRTSILRGNGRKFVSANASMRGYAILSI
jgi:hypothetical protein